MRVAIERRDSVRPMLRAKLKQQALAPPLFSLQALLWEVASPVRVLKLIKYLGNHYNQEVILFDVAIFQSFSIII